MDIILLVEDTIDNQLIVEDVFAFDEIGASLAIVENAEDALAFLQHTEPILILMDIRLPGMSGVEATRIIKADPSLNHIPIWAITAHAMKDVRRDAINSGCDEYVTKPLDAEDLASRLQRFIATQHNQGPIGGERHAATHPGC